MPDDMVFAVHLVIPASIADLFDEEPTTEQAIEFAHRYMHEMGSDMAPFLQPQTVLWPQGARVECANTLAFVVKEPWHGVPRPDLPDPLEAFRDNDPDTKGRDQ